MMLQSVDIWDPNTWEDTPHEFRIYGDDLAQTWAIVDAEDYQFFSRWRWEARTWRGKTYYARTYSYSHRGRMSLYLHKEIMLRWQPVPPSPQHTIVDHRNGNSMDCRRCNLRWATRSMNARNIRGRIPYDVIEDAEVLR